MNCVVSVIVEEKSVTEAEIMELENTVTPETLQFGIVEEISEQVNNAQFIINIEIQ